MLHKEELIKLTLEKSDLAIKAAKDNINLDNLETAQNRIYYAIFYAVSALAYENDFITSKHKQLMGWFNKKFIHENKIFGENMFDIYKNSFSNRLKGDYEILFLTNKEDMVKSIEEAAFFVEEIKKYFIKVL